MKEDERAYLAEKGYDPEYISFEEALAIERLCESRASARADAYTRGRKAAVEIAKARREKEQSEYHMAKFKVTPNPVDEIRIGGHEIGYLIDKGNAESDIKAGQKMKDAAKKISDISQGSKDPKVKFAS